MLANKNSTAQRHYALATENAYRHWIVEFLRFHRDGDERKHPATLGKLEIEAFFVG